MVLVAAGAEPSGLDLVLPDFAEFLWGVVGVVLLLAIVAGAVAVVVALVRNARSSQQQSVRPDRELNELAQRVRALEEQVQRQKVE